MKCASSHKSLMRISFSINQSEKLEGTTFVKELLDNHEKFNKNIFDLRITDDSGYQRR